MLGDGKATVYTADTHDVSRGSWCPPEEIAFVVVSAHSSLPSDIHSSILERLSSAYIVGELWLRCCLQDGRIYSRTAHPSFHALDTPFLPLHSLTKLRGHFSATVASVSNYVGPPRAMCAVILTMLGAVCTQKMNRKNTHLLCGKAAGPKFKKAQEWNLTVLTLPWLIHVCSTGLFTLPNDDSNAPDSDVKTVSIGHLTQFENMLHDIAEENTPEDASANQSLLKTPMTLNTVRNTIRFLKSPFFLNDV